MTLPARRCSLALAGLVVLVLVAACGGGGSASPTAPEPSPSNLTQGSQQAGETGGDEGGPSDDKPGDTEIEGSETPGTEGGGPGSGTGGSDGGAIRLEKATNGVDADSPDRAIRLALGSDVTWRYTIINRGSGSLTEIRLRDDREGRVLCDVGVIRPGERATCFAHGKVTVNGLYRNVGLVEGVYRTSPTGAFTRVSARDASHYVGFEED